MNNVPIAFAFDNNLVRPACVCITSLLLNAAEDTFYDIFVISSSASHLNVDPLDSVVGQFKNCSITYRHIGNDFEQGFEIRGITTPAYYRLMIPSLIPEYDKILYSDVDVIFREDLSKYYQIDINNSYFAGVDALCSNRPGLIKHVRETMKLPVENGFFYSGNLLINSRQILKDNLIPLFVDEAKKQYLYQDMDIINNICNGRIYKLPISFCLTNYLIDAIHNGTGSIPEDEANEALQRGIVHYNGMKPWQGLCYNQDIWWYYYRLSLVYDENFTYKFYDRITNETSRWSLMKRIKHVIRFFTR